MATNIEVLRYLRPDGGYIQRGETYEGIEFVECEPFTKAEYQAAFTEYNSLIAQKESQEKVKLEAALSKLAALGLDSEDLEVLGFSKIS